jgi:hypothetical protein
MSVARCVDESAFRYGGMRDMKAHRSVGKERKRETGESPNEYNVYGECRESHNRVASSV